MEFGQQMTVLVQAVSKGILLFTKTLVERKLRKRNIFRRLTSYIKRKLFELNFSLKLKKFLGLGKIF
jgi:hypothetical protein